MDKSALTNLAAAALYVIGFFAPAYNDVLMLMGLFALSGSLTNWIAIHMLFERVPFLYGSGVITRRFTDFKVAIKNLIIQEFFSPQRLQALLEDSNEALIPQIIDTIDYDAVYANLLKAISNSEMGGMLALIGGTETLEPLKEPIIHQLKQVLKSSPALDLKSFEALISKKIEQRIDQRLEELSPSEMKNIIQNIIQQHLGWLVVWGGVFGALIGFIAAQIGA